MMQHASVGVRNAARKGPNTLLHGGHNGPGGTAANPTSRSMHTANFLQTTLHAPHIPLPPRNPPYSLFSASKNLLQRFFTHLTAPGLRLPNTPNVHNYSSRSLHGTSLRVSTIQSSLSLPVRNSLRNYALQRQANTFLPRGPASPPPRCGGVAQVGLGIARNFSTARPIFEHIAQNVPVAVRALYEADLDVDMKGYKHVRPKASVKSTKTTANSKSMVREAIPKRAAGADAAHQSIKVQSDITAQDEIEHYFPSAPTLVTTYLSIPLAPTPTSRAPLPPDPAFVSTASDRGPNLLPPLAFLASLHDSHSTHALRVESLFARLDQANVWSRGGVRCYAYSQGLMHHRQHSTLHETERGIEGACTILKVEFKGWTKSEVRSAIGESGTGWCMIEEVSAAEGSQGEDYSDSDSLTSSFWDDHSPPTTPSRGQFGSIESSLIDPSESFILPSIDMSLGLSRSSFSSRSHPEDRTMPITIPLEMENDPWVDCYSTSELSSPMSSCSDLLDLIIDPPSLNGWFGVNPPDFGSDPLSHNSFTASYHSSE